MVAEVMEKAKEFGLPEDWAVRKRRDYLLSKLYTIDVQRYEKRRSIANLRNDDERRLVVGQIERLESERREYKSMLWTLEHPANGGVTDGQIEIARQAQVESLLPNPVTRNKTKCFNHDDKHPSMQVNATYVYCHCCCKAWDTIGILIQTRGMAFVEAVRFLNRSDYVV